MLVQFSFNNFKCFKGETTVNLTASKIKSNTFYTHKTDFNYSVLKTLAVYGANASGKTKLFEAMNFMRCVICPPKRDEKIPVFDFWQTRYDPFRLNTETQDDTSSFESIFIIEGIQYRYGFTLNRKEILSEWLYKKVARESLILSRNGQEKFYISPQFINDKIFNTVKSAGMISPTVPLISILATFNDALSSSIVNWFSNITIISANNLNTIDALTKNEKKNYITAFLNSFDINIDDISLHETSFDDVPDKIKAIVGAENLKNGKIYDGINTTHKVYNEYYERVGESVFSLEHDESFGTNRLFSLSWPLINALKTGSLILIDEIDSGIHTNIVKVIVSLFYMCSSTAQLVFNTQDSSLLGANIPDNSADSVYRKLFIKDQIYVINKNRYGESSALPVTDFRNDLRSNLEKIYLNGDISGVPYVDTDSLLHIIESE